jgi:hypothetical protein
MAAFALAALSLGTGQARSQSGDYVFAAAPTVEVNRVYRVHRYTGEMGACQYGLKDGTVGVTLCYGAGDGGGTQTEPGEYDLIGSKHEKESGIFRINRHTGSMSICYVLDDKVVCTPGAK